MLPGVLEEEQEQEQATGFHQKADLLATKEL